MKYHVSTLTGIVMKYRVSTLTGIAMKAFWRNKRYLVTLSALAAFSSSCSGTNPLAPLPSLSNAPPTKGEFNFKTVEMPAAQRTVATGINRAGDIVGNYADAAGVVHGFLLHGDVFTTFDYPGAVLTDARGIGDNGEIVGTYRLPGEPVVNVHGFRRSTSGNYVKVDFPGRTNTIAQRILPDGTILGCRHDNDLMATMRGVVIGGSGQGEIDVFASMHNGGTPDRRRIAGLYTNMTVTPNRGEGYVIDNGVFTPLLVLGSTFTAAWDVNPAGEIAGVYGDAAGPHGFVLTARGYISVDVPGATATRAFGINAQGNVVGSFVTAGKISGFLATPVR